MKVTKKYVIGCHVMWYEMEIFPEYVESCVQMLEGVENPENVTFDFCVNIQEYYEKIDEFAIRGVYKTFDFIDYFERVISKLSLIANVQTRFKKNRDDFYNIADYRRDLNHNNCKDFDYVLWGESDSLWPKQTLHIIESLNNNAGIQPKHIISFAYRKNWDSSWHELTHPLYSLMAYNENEVLTEEWSEKSYMSIQRMNELNDVEQFIVKVLFEPKFDGSCLVISSDLIKSGINIPHALLLAGEDTSFMEMCKRVLGNNYVQYHIENILRVHNRRHPKKRMYILNENNPQGFCDERKGDWWVELEQKSKYNLNNLFNQVKFETNVVYINGELK